MMTYEIFKEVVTEKFKDYLPPKYQNMDMTVAPVQKVNRTLDGISLTGETEGMLIAPTIYINDMYEHYTLMGACGRDCPAPCRSGPAVSLIPMDNGILCTSPESVDRHRLFGTAPNQPAYTLGR